MDERIIQFRVGAVVICAVIIAGILILLFGEQPFQPKYTVFIKPRTAPGVTKNTPVRKNGILIGRVAQVETTDEGVLLSLRIDQNEKLFSNEVCKIGTASFLGDAVIDFVPGSQPERGREITNGELFTNVAVERNPLEIIEVAINLQDQVADALDAIRRAANTVDQTGQGISEFTNALSQSMGEEGIANLAKNIEQTLTNFNALMINLNEVIGDEPSKESLRMSLQQLPALLEDFKLAIAETREAVNGFQQFSRSVDINLQNIEPLTEALGENGPQVIDQLSNVMGNAEEFFDQVSSLARALGESEGTVGKLINDPELYNLVVETLVNVRDVSIRLKPLMSDIRMLVDGLARDPGQLGLRGVLNNQPGGTGYKGTSLGGDGYHW